MVPPKNSRILICKKSLKRWYGNLFTKGEMYEIESIYDLSSIGVVYFDVKGNARNTQRFIDIGGKKNQPNIHIYFEWLPIAEIRKLKLQKINEAV